MHKMNQAYTILKQKFTKRSVCVLQKLLNTKLKLAHSCVKRSLALTIHKLKIVNDTETLGFSKHKDDYLRDDAI